MPKGKKKGKFEHRRTEQPYSSDEDAGIDMTIDNCSETSGQSDLKSNNEEAGFVNESENICCFDAEFEDALNTHLTYGHVYPDLEDEWDTDNDSDSHLEDPHVEVSHQGRPSTFVDTNLQVILASELHPQDQNEAQEKLEEKVLELVEALNARAAAARASAFDGLRAALQRRAFTVLAGHRVTLADHVTRALRRGREAERRAAAALVPILSLQIGEEGTEEFMNEVRPALVAGCTDKTSSLDTRTECCSSLAALCYLLEDDVSEMLAVLHMFETIFSGSYLKGDGSVKVSAGVVAEGGWHAAALDGWALLLPALPPPLAPPPARLAELLDAASLEVRMAAGVALAVAHERVADVADDTPDWAELRARLASLATDPHKYRAKRDRKLQRATFRDVLKYFEEGEVPELRVRVGIETIECDTWAARCAYGALAAALGAGLRPLAAASGALRAALGLPAASPLAPPAAKLNKLQRHLQNSAACKARTVARNKNRDKRSAALAI